MEVSRTNLLIPTDAVLERDINARDEAVSLDRITEILEPVKRLRLVILDACRDNPFVRSMRRTLATRTVRSGYGEIEEKSLPSNTLVAYAQRAGATADDGVGANNPYTTALLKHLPTPGLDIELALRRVRDDVLKATRNRQEPFKYGSLGGSEIALVPAKVVQAPASPPKPGVDHDKEMEITFWNAVKDAKSKKAEDARRDADAARAEQKRLAAAAEAQKSTVVAALLPRAPSATDTTPDSTALVRAIQTELKRIGCDPGPTDGIWGAKAKNALAEFARLVRMTRPSDTPTPEVLMAVLGE